MAILLHIRNGVGNHGMASEVDFGSSSEVTDAATSASRKTFDMLMLKATELQQPNTLLDETYKDYTG